MSACEREASCTYPLGLVQWQLATMLKWNVTYGLLGNVGNDKHLFDFVSELEQLGT